MQEATRDLRGADARLPARGRLRNPPVAALRWVKFAVFLLCLAPLANLVAAFLRGRLGVNPIETITHSTGTWTLVFLLVTLAVTPLRRLSGWNWLLRLRRMLGLYAFFYACLHLVTYVWLDQFFDAQAIVKDIVKRPFITVGFAAWVLLVPLAATSANAMVRWLGGKQWLALHRLVYAIAVLGVLHYWWLVKRDVTKPAWYAVVLTVLLGFRLLDHLARVRRRG